MVPVNYGWSIMQHNEGELWSAAAELPLCVAVLTKP